METLINCPSCNSPFKAPDLTNFIYFPNDIETIFDLVEGRLNVIECPICKVKVTVQALLVILNKKEKKSIVAANKATEIKELEALKERFSVEFVEGYLAARAAVLKWLNNPLEKALSEFVKEKDPDFVTHFSPLQLRLLLSGVRGFVPLTIYLSGGEDVSSSLKSLYVS